jgi:glycosyl transferase, family 25
MRRLIEAFDRSYVINLADRVDRRSQVEREFRRLGIPIPSDKVRVYSAQRFAESGGFSDVGTRGNFDSHRNILGLAQKDNLRNVLIFEDDVSFRNVGSDVERQIVSCLEAENWDLIYFGYLEPSITGAGGKLVPWRKDVIGAHFYAVNGRFIPLMFDYMNSCERRVPGHPEGGPMTTDGAYNHVRHVMPNLRAFIAAPNLAYQRSSRTDISRPRSFDKVQWLTPAISAARAIKHRLRMAIDAARLRNPTHS